MAGEWKETHVGNLLSFANGRSSPERADGLPYPVYGSNGIIGYASEANADPGAIIIGRVGSYCGSLYQSPQRCWVTDNAIRGVAKNGNDPRFLFYLLGTLALNSRRAGSGQPLLNQDILSSIPASVPEPDEQRAIAHILGTVDDKIELNRRRNQTLEAMACALFQDWFVDFGPVRAKMEGREPYLPADLWQLFPDRLDNKGKPEGWVVGTVADLCSSITSGGTPARKKAIFWDGGTIPWFKTGELQDGPLLDSEEKITEAALIGSSCKLWPAGTILFALYASPTVGRLGLLTSPGTSNQAAAGLIAKEAIGVPFLRRVLLEAREKLQNIAVGAAQQNINQAILKAHQLVMPPECLSAHYSELVGYWDDQQIQLAYEMKTLARLRDTLLPKLISGELRIADAKRFVKDHLP